MECECKQAGFCPRYQQPMHGRLFEICRGENIDPGEAEKYRVYWKQQAEKQAANGVPKGTVQAGAKCQHLGEHAKDEHGELKWQECPTCSGKVKLKVFGCNHPSTADEVTLQDCAVCPYAPRVPVQAANLPLSVDSPKTAAKPLLLTNHLSPGDVLVMTAAVYSLHKAHPGKYTTAIDTTANQLWEHNPDIVPAAPEAQKIAMHYPLVNECNQRAVHVMQGYCDFLSSVLQVPIPLMTNRPMIWLSDEEKKWMNQVHETTGKQQRFWIVNSGHKLDYPTKLWPWYQEVVDKLQGKVLFVQVGAAEHVHAPLRGVVNLVGKTDQRQLCRLFHHADGVLCGVSFPMHLAAAFNKPAVVIAGGREPRTWNTYPRQVLLNTVGMLPCCRDGGCWRSRTVPLNDNDEKDKSLCDHPVFTSPPTPKCMAIISPDEVVENVVRYTIGA